MTPVLMMIVMMMVFMKMMIVIPYLSTIGVDDMLVVDIPL